MEIRLLFEDLDGCIDEEVECESSTSVGVRSKVYRTRIDEINTYFNHKAKSDAWERNRQIVDVLHEADRTGVFFDEGHSTLNKWIAATFPKSSRHYGQILQNAEFHKVIFGQYHMPFAVKDRSDDPLEDRKHIKEGVTREITCLPVEAWPEVWLLCKEVARTKEYYGEARNYHKNKVTSVISREAANKWRSKNNLLLEDTCITGTSGQGNAWLSDAIGTSIADRIVSMTRMQKANLFSHLMHDLWPDSDLGEIVKMEQERFSKAA